MTVKEYIAKQEPQRAKQLGAIHKIIVDNNKRVVPEVSKMMGQEIIQYKVDGTFMYGLSSAKSHMSLHLLPMYGSSVIHSRYKKLLDKAKFQKGCINFTQAEQMPLAVVEQLIKDCARCENVIIEHYRRRKAK